MSLRALIVDDNGDFLTTARQVLEREGMEVVALASTGTEAVRSAQEHRPDVVLVDVDLGDESGFDVVERLTARTHGDVAAVLISAYPEQDLRDLLAESSAIGFVPKSQLSVPAIVHLLRLHDRDTGDRSS